MLQSYKDMTTEVPHSTSITDIGDTNDLRVDEYVKNPGKYVMMAAMAERRHIVVEDRWCAEREWADDDLYIAVEYNDNMISVIYFGIC
jgi:hypothetical protein